MTASKACRLPWMSEAMATCMAPYSLIGAQPMAPADRTRHRLGGGGGRRRRHAPARAYFSPTEIERAEDFRTGQIWLGVGQMALGIGALVVMVRRPPRRLMAL